MNNVTGSRMHQRALRDSTEAVGMFMRAIVGMGVIVAVLDAHWAMIALVSLVGSARKLGPTFFLVRNTRHPNRQCG